MCGIAGLVSARLSGQALRDPVARMVEKMRHRGPDGASFLTDGPCSLGHARLAVIDTSAAGSQPMSREGVHLVYNGELYNFIDERDALAEQGHVFLGHSDAEVLLALYLRHELDFLDRLRGMYAFALWDSRKNLLLCARDPLGIKPFLYQHTPQGFIFASEIKALLASGLVSSRVDRAALRAMLQRGSVPQPGSILQGVHQLLPGQVLTLEPGQTPRIRRFHAPRTGAVDLDGASWPELVKAGGDLLDDVIARQVVADVPLGAFLSGGLDSSLLVALMARRSGHVRTFSVGFEQGLETGSDDETDDAAVVAAHLGVSHTRVLVTQADVAENLRAVAKGLDHPTVDGVNSWFVARAARRELTVAISGTGGDELFAGYPWFAAMREFADAPWGLRLRRRLRGETFASAFAGQYRIFAADEAAALCPGTPDPGSQPDPLPLADPLSRVTGLNLCGYTRDQLLADIDTAAMWHGLEVRVPLLDERLLDFALSLPPEAKIGPGDQGAPAGSYAASGIKRLLMELARPLLPAGFERRAKRGFTLPFDGWLRGMLAPLMNDLLSGEVVARRDLFQPEAARAVAEGFRSGRMHWTRPWLLMMTELWAQEVLDG